MHKILFRVAALGIISVAVTIAGAQRPISVVAASDAKTAAVEPFTLPDWAEAIMSKTTSFEVYSLDPAQDVKPEDKTTLHDWKVLGKTTLKRTDEAGKKLVDALSKSRTGLGAKCFDPRHAIRAEHDGKKVDILICFECGWAYVYPSNGELVHLKIDTTAQPAFNKILTDAKVPLPKQ